MTAIPLRRSARGWPLARLLLLHPAGDVIARRELARREPARCKADHVYLEGVDLFGCVLAGRR